MSSRVELLRFDVHELEDEVLWSAEPDQVELAEDLLALDSKAVEIGAIQAPEVLQDVGRALRVEADSRVLTRDSPSVENDGSFRARPIVACSAR